MTGWLRPSRNRDSPGHPRVVWSVVPVGLAVLVFPRDAHAYLDTGTASMVLQLLVASAAAGMVFFRQYRDKLKAFLGRRSREPDESAGGEDS